MNNQYRDTNHDSLDDISFNDSESEKENSFNLSDLDKNRPSYSKIINDLSNLSIGETTDLLQSTPSKCFIKGRNGFICKNNKTTNIKPSFIRTTRNEENISALNDNLNPFNLRKYDIPSPIPKLESITNQDVKIEPHLYESSEYIQESCFDRLSRPKPAICDNSFKLINTSIKTEKRSSESPFNKSASYNSSKKSDLNRSFKDKKPTIPRAFEFESEKRVQYYHQKKMEIAVASANSPDNSIRPISRCNSILYLKREPFLPTLACVEVTEPESPKLILSSRMERRNKEIKEKNIKREENLKKCQEIMAKLERQEIAEIRRKIDKNFPKPRPVPNFKVPVNRSKSFKTLDIENQKNINDTV